jgi:acyl-CoA dehydrogenase
VTPAFWDDTHRALKASLDGWVSENISPHAANWEDAQAMPDALFAQAGDAGVLGIGYSEEVGGSGGDIFHRLIAVESLIRGGSTGAAVTLGIHAISIPPIIALGTKEQVQEFVPPVLEGARVAALGVTEPGAGSDVAGIKTSAVRDGDHYVINGAKTFITAGTRADFITLLARTSDDPHSGLTFFIVERGTPGFSVGRNLKKMGWWASDTAELFFSDCRVPVGNRLGDEGSGFLGAMHNFANERLILAANCVAIGQLALDASIRHAKERHAFGRPIGTFQVNRHKIAEMATKLEGSRAFLSAVAARYRDGADVMVDVAMVKNHAVEMCSFVTDAAVQLHGGMGYMRESLVERLYRDARLYPIGGGTTEIMRELIGRHLVG